MTRARGPLNPQRMTAKWLTERTDVELVQLAEEWPSCYSRGVAIRQEINRREAAVERQVKPPATAAQHWSVRPDPAGPFDWPSTGEAQ